MRKLSLLSKRLIDVNFNFVLIAYTFLVFVGCKTPSVNIEKNSTSSLHPYLNQADSTSELKQIWIDFRTRESPQKPGFLRFNSESCLTANKSFLVTLKVLEQIFDVSFEVNLSSPSIASIEDVEVNIQNFELSPRLSELACGIKEGEPRFIEISNDEYNSLATLVTGQLQLLVPDCKGIDWTESIARCRLDSLAPEVALVQTEQFQKSMIRTWSRQPYILARRMGVVSTLARAIQISNNSEDAFLKFCRVLQFSLVEELPVVMTSRRWQSALCSHDMALRTEAALYGLAKGVHELEVLKELYEDTSRVGVLSVKIPSQKIPGNLETSLRMPLRVTIAPDENVSKKLVEGARRYLGRTEDDHKSKILGSWAHSKSKKSGSLHRRPRQLDLMSQLNESKLKEMCWHPLFGESLGLMKIADGMRLTGTGFNYDCVSIYDSLETNNKAMASLSRYLTQSLSSETEFVLDNGQSKLLRLPEGKYKYTVHVLPLNPLDSEEIDDENVPKTTGEFGWGATSTHSIRSW